MIAYNNRCAPAYAALGAARPLSDQVRLIILIMIIIGITISINILDDYNDYNDNDYIIL
jgi:hypothetical protein